MNTLFDKIWDAHVVTSVAGGPDQLYIDRHYCHEVTSPQAFNELRERKLKVFRPQKTVCSPDHNIPTLHQDRPIADPVSRNQVDTLARNAREFGLTYYGLGNEKNGIIHVIGPEYGLTLPGMTIVCGDSHTSTHGAFGAIAFGIGTSEVAMVLASQCILQPKPQTMRINIEGQLAPGVTAKDIALYIIARMTTGGATGYFVEYAGEAIRALSMEERMTVCNLSIEMGARGGLIAPDETTFAYVKEREFAPKGEAWDRALAYWKTLHSDADATFDREVTFQAADIAPRITYGTNPGMGIAIDEAIPTEESIDESGKLSFRQALRYMGFEAGEKLLGKKNRLRLLGQLHQRSHRRLQSLCPTGEGASESRPRDRLARARFASGSPPDQGRRARPHAGRSRVRDTSAGLLGLPGHERRQSAGRQICGIDLEPQLRRASGPRSPHHPGRAAGSGSRSHHG